MAKTDKYGGAVVVPATPKSAKELVDRVGKQLDSVSAVAASFLFRGNLDLYISGFVFLVDLVAEAKSTQLADLRTANDADTVFPKLKPTVRRLCELSREVVFACDPSRLTSDFRASLKELFLSTAATVPDSTDSKLCEYRDNIASRTLEECASAEPCLH